MLQTTKTRVLIVDDSVLVRALLRELLESDSEIEVVGEAANGREAIDQVLLLKPDLVTMDLEMPIMGGHEAIQQIMAQSAVPILVVSSLDDAKNAYEAISNGALDVVSKPQLASFEVGQFTKKVKNLSKIKVIKHLRSLSSLSISTAKTGKLTRPSPVSLESAGKDIFVIASSTGGPQALLAILQKLPLDFTAPIVVAQHISKGFESGLVEWLNQNVSLRVKVADNSELLISGQIYIAPANFNMTIGKNRCVTLSTSLESDIYHPNCDILLTSAAQVYGQKAVAVICTGMGRDGAAGMEAIRAVGGVTLAQDEKSSVVFGMNHEAISRNCIDHVLSLEAIASKILSLGRCKSA